MNTSRGENSRLRDTIQALKADLNEAHREISRLTLELNRYRRADVARCELQTAKASGRGQPYIADTRITIE